MLCQNCGQREANVHFTRSINGKITEYYFCDLCAQKTQEVNIAFHQGKGMPEFLQALLGLYPSMNAPAKEDACPGCGITFSQITRAGKLGCSQCYETFETQLETVLQRIHGGGQHEGKIPSRWGNVMKSRVELKNLKDTLQLLILEENFEKAAQVRDQIRSLEQHQEVRMNEPT